MKLLTYPSKFNEQLGSKKVVFLLPLMISSIITPKLNTSDLVEKTPCTVYSGDI